MKKIINIQTLLILAILVLPVLAHAQTDPGADPESAPIDGGLSILIAGGVGYGIKKIKNKIQQDK
ncbi:MAG: hypothetical protein KGO81_01635 [Bacteroidota bacterium]|nr:hypothetical protein [Bacteroidota bacterium]